MGIEAVMIAAAVASAGSAIYSGVQQKHVADANAEMTRREGNQQADAAVAQAEKIRRAGQAAASQANASLAASGVAIGEGTAVRINEQINKDSENDAFNTLLTGSRRQRAASDQAGMLQYEGNAAQTAGYISAGASLLSSGANYGKWKTSQKGAS